MVGQVLPSLIRLEGAQVEQMHLRPSRTSEGRDVRRSDEITRHTCEFDWINGDTLMGKDRQNKERKVYLAFLPTQRLHLPVALLGPE